MSALRQGLSRLATSVCQPRHDQMEQGPTERWTQYVPTEFWWCGGAGITEWPLVRGRLLLRTSFPCLSGTEAQCPASSRCAVFRSVSNP